MESNCESRVSSNHDHIICYSKSENIYPIRETVNQDKSQFNYFDEVKQLFYRRRSIRKEGMNSLKTDAPSAFFALFSPDNEEVYPIKPNGIESCWRWSKETYLEELSKGNVEWIKKDDKWEVYAKQYFADISERSPLTVWLHNEVGHNHSASEELSKIIGARIFDSPKPIALLKKIFKIATTQHSLILDSFAGSGTTMHAIMDLNKEDGGNRKCIMIQMPEATEAEPKKNICKDITRERVKRAIDKYGYDSGFQYFKVGIPLDAESLLSGNLPTFKQFADYVYYLCTGESLKNNSAVNEKSYFVGEYGNSVIYLVYKQDFDELTRMALNLTLAEKITAEHPKKKIIVYAPACFLEEDYMKEKNIDYAGIPYNLFRRT
ncbi:MAG: hypothetical protein HZB37_10780 [Planctomycetes bacterium]|nr:hypothetical protein [Planctomycetota bacterium]